MELENFVQAVDHSHLLIRKALVDTRAITKTIDIQN